MKKSRKSKKYKIKLSIPAQIIALIGILVIYLVNFSGIFNIQNIIVLEENQATKNSNIQNLLLDIHKKNLILTKSENIKTRITQPVSSNKQSQNQQNLPKHTPESTLINSKPLPLSTTPKPQTVFIQSTKQVIENQSDKPINLPELLIPHDNLMEGIQVITTDKIQYMVDAFNYFYKKKLKLISNKLNIYRKPKKFTLYLKQILIYG